MSRTTDKSFVTKTHTQPRGVHPILAIHSATGLPMTLGNMRELGVRSLAVACELCHQEAVLPADRWPNAVLVRAFRPRMLCTACGIVGADARPIGVR
jgi:hypothetical protein